jgi:uncharacterized FAD-dependent dehydrogenase
MLRILNLKLPLEAGAPGNERLVVRAIARKAHVQEDDIVSWRYLKRSVDARRKSSVHYVAQVAVEVSCDESSIIAACHDGSVTRYERPAFPNVPHVGNPASRARPVVVGSGPAGLFAALVLAQAGARPLLIERGDDVERRLEAVRRFNGGGELDPESNIPFGEGGAGTFSDGKLTTGTRSPHHPFILQTFVDSGAPNEILWQARPHIGSDILPRMVKGLRGHIEELGGEVFFRTRLDDVVIERGRVTGIGCTQQANGGERRLELDVSHLVLAIGHSARETFEMLSRHGVAMSQKPFSMGVRIEHLQEDVDRAQYGRSAGYPGLGAASYKLSCHLDETDLRGLVRRDRARLPMQDPSELSLSRGVYTFCMCPGGSVLAAGNEQDGVVTNGGSRFARDGRNANAGLLVNVGPEDFGSSDPLAGVRLQRACERRAFHIAGGNLHAPAQLVGDFLAGRPSLGPGAVSPTYPRGVTWTDLATCLPPAVVLSLRAGIPRLGQKLRGFDAPDAVLTGVETRSSSPVRIERNELFESSVRGLYPCGEGAGYAGGIMSAAADGVNVALSILSQVG